MSNSANNLFPGFKYIIRKRIHVPADTFQYQAMWRTKNLGEYKFLTQNIVIICQNLH
jgi:hypothetical protein